MIADSGKGDQRQGSDEADVVPELRRHDLEPLRLVLVARVFERLACGLEQSIALRDCDPAADHQPGWVEDIRDGHNRGSERTPGVVHDYLRRRVASIFE